MNLNKCEDHLNTLLDQVHDLKEIGEMIQEKVNVLDRSIEALFEMVRNERMSRERK
jgi:hypothetical protein